MAERKLGKIPKGFIRVTLTADLHSGACKQCMDGFSVFVKGLEQHEPVEQPKKGD
ncbi:hypothetical protein LCGC14_0587690 [marine sediment metagenome]|uniref:Uncharacterized protein n=1 Tax=marine sediment metagenome TaxID=412755 RepID=A0A0F9U0L3_9ZZZZ